jgi:hypothetical protein
VEEQRERLAHRFARHAAATAWSPMYSDLMARCAADIEAGGPVWRLMAGHEGPSGSVPALRLLGAVHRLVLSGRAPALAAYYPSAGGTYDGEAAWPAFLGVVRSGAPEPWLDATVQTNEVGRAAVLMPGFATVSLAYGMPLRPLEVGASGGLLLRFDSYRYVTPSGAWGPADSPVVLDGYVTGVPLDPALRVAGRRGCDSSPIDVTTPEGRLLLESYVWPDQAERVARLRAACDVAARVPARVDADDAVEWVRTRLAEPADGAVPVVYHSVVMQYLSPEGREAFAAAMHDATVEPRAWLRYEPGEEEFELRLTTWPGGEERLLATAHAHGYDVRWLTT